MSDRAKQELAVYAVAMAHEIKDNAHKGHWLESAGGERDDLDLLSDLLYHFGKLAVAVRMQDPAAILEYAADVGNCAWFVADAHGALKEELVREGPIEYDPYSEMAGVAAQVFSTLRQDSLEFTKKILGGGT